MASSTCDTSLQTNKQKLCHKFMFILFKSTIINFCPDQVVSSTCRVSRLQEGIYQGMVGKRDHQFPRKGGIRRTMDCKLLQMYKKIYKKQVMTKTFHSQLILKQRNK